MSKKTKMVASLFFLLFFIFIPPLKSDIHQATWIINPTKMKAFDSTEQQRLEKVLSLYDIKVVYDEMLEQGVTQLNPAQLQKLTPLFEGKHVDVVVINPAQEDLHIGLIVKDITTLQGEGLAEFEKGVRHIIQTFHDLNYGDYIGFCDLGKTYIFEDGTPMKGHCWEMIPLGKGHTLTKKGSYFLAPKIWRNSYLLFNSTPYFKSTKASVVRMFKKILHLRMTQSLSHSPNFRKETLPWELTIPDFKETRDVTLERLLTELKNKGAVRVVEAPGNGSDASKRFEKAKGEEFSSHKTHTRENCAFCKEKVLNTQEMIRGQNVTVIYNYLPYIKKKHFMVVPLSHQERFYALPADHFEEIIQWAQKLTRALKAPKNVIWFCQNGPFGGQTTPHAHLHVLERPAPVPLLSKILGNLSGQKEEFPTEDDYKAIRSQLLNALKSKKK